MISSGQMFRMNLSELKWWNRSCETILTCIFLNSVFCFFLWLQEERMFTSFIFTFWMCVKLSQQVLELFQACQQQTCDLNRKELCRSELQREIQRIFPCMFWIWLLNIGLNVVEVHNSSLLWATTCHTRFYPVVLFVQVAGSFWLGPLWMGLALVQVMGIYVWWLKKNQ